MVVYAAADAATGLCASTEVNEQSERRSSTARDALCLLAPAMPKVRYGFVQCRNQRCTVGEIIMGDGRRRKAVQIYIDRDTNRQSERN